MTKPIAMTINDVATAPINKPIPYDFNPILDSVAFADELSFNPTCRRMFEVVGDEVGDNTLRGIVVALCCSIMISSSPHSALVEGELLLLGSGLDGLALGDFVGGAIGVYFTCVDGMVLGNKRGKSLAIKLGTSLGIILGASLGIILGVSLGIILGESLGIILGESLGIILGESLRMVLGESLGIVILGGSLRMIILGESLKSIILGESLLDGIDMDMEENISYTFIISVFNLAMKKT